jgi:hypothetical protein
LGLLHNNSKVLRLAAGLLACLSLAEVLQSHNSTAHQRQTWTVALPPERALTVYVTVGDVRIQGEPRADAVVDVVRTAGAEAASRVPVTLEELAGEVRLSAVQAAGGMDPEFRSDVTVRVPNAASIRAIHIMEGRLTLASLRGAVDADVRRGPIDAADIQGSIRLETGIGNIVAQRARLSDDGLLRLRTFNGNVRLALAERPAHARILALALNGTVESDIPLRMKDAWGPRWGEATLGKGEPVISIDVVTGRIEIRAP